MQDAKIRNKQMRSFEQMTDKFSCWDYIAMTRSDLQVSLMIENSTPPWSDLSLNRNKVGALNIILAGRYLVGHGLLLIDVTIVDFGISRHLQTQLCLEIETSKINTAQRVCKVTGTNTGFDSPLKHR